MIETSRLMECYGPTTNLMFTILLFAISFGMAAIVLLKEEVYVGAAITEIIAVLLFFGTVNIYDSIPQREIIKCIIRGTIDWDEFTSQYEILKYESSDGVFVVTPREQDALENMR